MKYTELKEMLQPQADICRATLPSLFIKPENEKTLDDTGLQFIMTGFLFLFDDYVDPSTDQMSQLRQTAAACAETYRGAMETADGTDEEEGMLNLCYGFLLLYNFKMSNDKSKMN